jgi:hypothetical protein
LPAYPDIEISPAWFPIYGGSTFPEEFGDRGTTTTGELLNEVMQGEAGMIVASRTGVVYGFGRYYYDYLIVATTSTLVVAIRTYALRTATQYLLVRTYNIIAYIFYFYIIFLYKILNHILTL